ncbi:MAG: hypothetical protein M1840_001429 [Geoglossum simile]|nr:MAG: hypothetical protein M1840_001429 [Geoglossum simile]
MGDSWAIVLLKPYTPDAIAIANLPANNKWLAGQPEQHRESLPDEIVQSPEDEAGTREATPCDKNGCIFIRLGFDVEPRNGSLGFLFGRETPTTPRDTLFPDIVFPNVDSIGRPVTDVSRFHFRIHYNLLSGVLMITDTSTNGTIHGGRLLRRESMPLMAENTIQCGTQGRIGFTIQPHETSDLYEHNYRHYALMFGCKPNTRFLPTPTPRTDQSIRPLGPDYSIYERIGSGKSGVVNTVIRNKDGLVLAAKEIAGKEEDGGITFPLEVEILRKLSHPNIVCFVDALILGGRVHVIMERLPMHLSDYRKAHRQLDVACIKSISRQILSGLEYLHREGVTHRDIKPENILVSAHDARTGLPTVKLADFGVSSQRPELTTFCGTPLYLAPELHETDRLNKSLLRGRRREGRPNRLHSYTPAVDIWATGVVLHNLLGGVCERRGTFWHPTEETRTKIPLGNSLVRRMLSEDPERRPTASGCLLHHWLSTDTNTIDRPAKRRRSPPPLSSPSKRPR